MPGWLTLTVTACFALTALWLTVRAWQVRKTTPRTLSLAFSATACLAILIAAGDVPIPLHSLCEHQLHPTGTLESELKDILQHWTWRLYPCRRVQLHPRPEHLATPINFAVLAALAANAGIAVDVSFPPTAPRRGDGLLLHHPGWNLNLPISTSIPPSQTRDVSPRIAGASTGPTVCTLDGGAPQTDPSLYQLIQASGLPSYHGFHHVECHEVGQAPDSAVADYVHIAVAEVVLAADADLGDRPLIFADDPSPRNFDPYEMRRVPEPPRGSPEDRHALATAATLILDRPQRPETCEVARQALLRGASVVVAMPEDPFLAACHDVLPLVTGGRDGENKRRIFDREPRLTYVLDNFASDLDLRPSCILGDCDEQRLEATEPATLTPSLDVQRSAARQSCGKLTADVFIAPQDCSIGPTTLETSREALVRILDPLEKPSSRLLDRERLRRSTPKSTLEPLVTTFSGEQVQEFRENELIIVFTHDHRPSSEESILNTGAQVLIAQVRDPYATSLSELFKDEHDARIPDPFGLVKDPSKRRRIHTPDCEGDRCVALPEDIKLIAADRQTTADWARSPRSRFRPEHPVAGPAPLRFGWWEYVRTPKRLGEARVASTTADNGLRERALVMGMMVDRGHLLFLSYSPFEIPHHSKVPDATYRDAMGGYRILSDLHRNTSALHTSAAGNVQSVALQPDGALWISIGMLGSGVDVAKQLSFATLDPKRTIEAPLVDIDDARGELTYALPARELMRLEGCAPYHQHGGDERDPVFACRPRAHGGSRGAMDAVMSLRMLASYSGGREIDAEDPDPPSDVLRTRAVGLVMLSLTLLLAWGRRAARRLAGSRAYRRLRHLEQLAQRRYDPPDAVVAAAGDWDGRSSTWPRTGAFGGFRPLEAGDRPSAIVLQDIVLPDQGGPQLLPRVVQRIEEASPSVLVLVNLGESMRMPDRGDHGKAVFAGHVALHVAAAAWKIRGEVEIHAVGVEGESEIVAPTRLSPGYEELALNLRARLEQRPHRAHAPWPDELPECGSVVYVSDLLLEDTHALQAWVARLEGAGVRVGGVMVYSPLEFTMIEGGRLAGSGVWADRTDWDPDDVFAAFNRRRDALELIFDAVTTGGLLVAGTHFNQDDVEVALESGRLLQILR